MTKKSIFRRLYASISIVFLMFSLLQMFIYSQNAHWLLTVILFLVSLVVIGFFFHWHLSPLSKAINAVNNGVSAFNDNDFSITIHNQHYDEISKVITIYNQIASTLRKERMDIFQRELLLETVIETTPVALILTNRNGHIVYCNLAIKELLGHNKNITGRKLEDIWQALPAALLKATQEKATGLVTDTSDEISKIYHVTYRKFTLNGSEHSLYLYKNMTTDISRKETDMWKQAIRLISHELNNSLAPIASLTRSAQKIIEQPAHIHMLDDVLKTIGSRTEHLHQFISQYAKFARLPLPKYQAVNLADFSLHLNNLVTIATTFNVSSAVAYFDQTQIEQVIINLVKNAQESGSTLEDTGLSVIQQGEWLSFIVFDRGSGMNEHQMQQAILPFFTTKTTGTGVGLALCNEIINGHQGQLQLANREHGGLSVSFKLSIKQP